MIEAIAVSRDAQNKMDELWDMGVEAARHIKLEAEATVPYSSSSNIEYGLDGYESDAQVRCKDIHAWQTWISWGYPVDSACDRNSLLQVLPLIV
jgi:hypothetical protein